ncbi:hypothetical protein V2J09_018331 [Rumex salicifolius]
MGKRKERRHAALLGAGRRVKLDLFAEPSGDVGGSLAEEVKGGVDTKLEAGLPKSPSSSGQQPANPLLLLGQYSDDDMEERSSDDNQDTTQMKNDEQIKPNNKELEELNVASSEEHLSKNNELCLEKDVASKESLQVLGSITVGESNVSASNELTHEKHLESPQQLSTRSASDVHATGDDAKLCWKMVLHEESNSYYYWNTETGETSWEVPPDLAQGAVLTCEPQTSLAEDNSHRDVYTSIATGSANEVTYHLFSGGSLIAQSIDEYKGDESQLFTSSGSNGVFHQENVTLGSFSSYVPPIEPIGSWGATAGASNIYLHGDVTNIQDGTAVTDLPSHLVKRGESLLDKLRSLKGSEDTCNEKHAWTSKYIYEIEIRLFDLKSLLSCGPALASFWVHSEAQLKRLEDAINSEIGSYVEAELKDEINSAQVPPYVGREATQENRNAEFDLGEELTKGVVSHGKSCIELDDVQLPRDVQSSFMKEASCGDIPSIKLGLEVTHDRSQPIEEEIISNEATVHTNVNADVEGEEDMDVDMEVEDISLPSVATATETVYNHVIPSEQLGQPGAPADQQPLLTGGESFPSPPDDDWIPPPPPDNEDIPPPPPDEPPESFCPPPPASYPDTVQTLTYPASYNMIYPDPNYSFYGHAGVTLPNQPIYYEAVPSSDTVAPGTLNNHLGSVVYYVQDAATPLVTTEAPSSFQAALAPSVLNAAQSQMGSFRNSNVDTYAVHVGTEPTTSQTTNPSISAAACAATQESISASQATTSTSSAAVSAVSTASDSSAVAAANPQTKAPRAKKRTVAVASSLRSNKKVSSLVNKWKAAKEEMEEAEEEEAENTLMILEKKRQRGIEEWRAQQIASGEARENANFQPLGGDWRERVKRKRAKKAVSAETRVEESIAEKKQPNLTENSKGLPPGWQAYWDESSKKVYYGNTITSETRWTRPT